MKIFQIDQLSSTTWIFPQAFSTKIFFVSILVRFVGIFTFKLKLRTNLYHRKSIKTTIKQGKCKSVSMASVGIGWVARAMSEGKTRYESLFC